MLKLLDFIACTSTVLTELISIFILAIIVQAVLYKVFGFNLFKWIRNKLVTVERRIQGYA